MAAERQRRLLVDIGDVELGLPLAERVEPGRAVGLDDRVAEPGDSIEVSFFSRLCTWEMNSPTLPALSL